MPYLLPARVMRSTSVLDFRDINEDYLPAAEKVSGRLDQHDFASSIRSSLDVAAGAYYQHSYDYASADPEFGSPGSDSRPTRTNSVQIPTHGGWVAVSGLSRTVTTGTAVLNIIARLQYVWFIYHTVNGWNPGSAPDTPAGVQFAIAVDGRILEWTITGVQDIQRRPPWAIRAQSPQRVFTGASPTLRPGGFQPRSERCVALGPNMGSVRLGSVFPVTPGEHIVEVYCRRLRGFDGSTSSATDQGIYIYNRQLFTQTLRVLPSSSQTLSSVEIDALEPEDDFSASTIGTDRVTALLNAYNSVAAGALARGAFNHHHLPSAIRDWAQVSTQPGVTDPTTDDYYPGWNNNTRASAATGDTGWWLLQDGTGAPTNLRTDETHAGVFDMTYASTFLVLANVHVRHVENVPDEIHCFGALAIMYQRTGGTPLILPETEGYICNWNHWGVTNTAASTLNEETDIPLMAVVSLPAGATDVDWFGVYGCAFDDNGNRAELEYGVGNLTVIQFRDELTA